MRVGGIQRYVYLHRYGVNGYMEHGGGSGFVGFKLWPPNCLQDFVGLSKKDNMNKLFELFPGAKLGVARVRPICAGVPAPTNRTNEV